jgi:hypothetical protein
MPSAEKTDAWIMLDASNLYVSALLGRPAATRSGHRAPPRQQQLLQCNGGSKTREFQRAFTVGISGRGSELFVVYGDGRNRQAPGYPDLVNCSIAVKVTRLLRFETVFSPFRLKKFSSSSA